MGLQDLLPVQRYRQDKAGHNMAAGFSQNEYSEREIDVNGT